MKDNFAETRRCHDTVPKLIFDQVVSLYHFSSVIDLFSDFSAGREKARTGSQ